MLKAIRSYYSAMKASAALGRASRLHRQGKNADALLVAREGLALLNKPVVDRQSAPQGAVLTTLTVLVEQLASEFQEPGAPLHDLRDALTYLSRLKENPTPEASDQLAWVPYLESRIEQQL